MLVFLEIVKVDNNYKANVIGKLIFTLRFLCLGSEGHQGWYRIIVKLTQSGSDSWASANNILIF